MGTEHGGRRFAGIELGRWGPPEAPSPARRTFDAAAERADRVGVRWHDLIQEGYRVPGDLVVGGITVHYDWKWRTAELERRIADAEPKETGCT